MFKGLRQLSFLFVLLAFQSGFAQQEKLTSKDVVLLLTKSGDCFSKLECDKSLNFAKEALRGAHKINDNILIARSCNLIGLNLYEFSEYSKAINFYNKGIYYANLSSNDTLKKNLYNNLGNVYCFREIDVKKGIANYEKALFFASKIKDEFEINYVKLNLASAYFRIGDYKKGYPYLKSIQKYFDESDELEAKLSISSLFADYYSSINENTKAEAFYKEAIRLGRDDKDGYFKTYVCEVYDDFAHFYFKIGDYKNAYLYLDKYNKLNQELFSEKRGNSVETAGLKIELDEYKRQIDKIEFENDIQKKNLEQSKMMMILFAIIVLILLLFLYTLYKNNKFRIKINNELTVAYQELKTAKENEEESSRIKAEFLSTISHELRTPLYGIIGITNMILDEHKELVNSPYLNSLKFSARYLLSMVNDILNINKIDENKIILDSFTFNISDKISNVMGSLEFIANKNNNKLECQIDAAIPLFLIGDEHRLSQILMNLVGNALKFTKNGKVVIIVDLVRVDGKNNYIKFQIKDNGIGIAKDNQKKIFEKFVQVGRKEEDYQGTGLGLHIVQGLLELFDSKISLESKEGEGTVFSFIIGFEVDMIKTNKIINEIEVDLTSSQIFKVLVVEDNKINQMVTRKILEGNNYKCQVVDDGLIAIKLLKKETFDVILMDLNMPVINGFDTSIKIRELEITTPIIALTAFTREEVIDEVIESGMNDMINKPFEPVKLFEIIENQINRVKNAN